MAEVQIKANESDSSFKKSKKALKKATEEAKTLLDMFYAQRRDELLTALLVTNGPR